MMLIEDREQVTFWAIVSKAVVLRSRTIFMDGHLTESLLETALDVVMPLLELHGVLSKFCAFEQILLIQQSIRYHLLMLLVLCHTQNHYLVKIVAVSASINHAFHINISMHPRILAHASTRCITDGIVNRQSLDTKPKSQSTSTT
jgi:hypothetical protein